MPTTNINRVTITGNLTHDPAVKTLESGVLVCHLRVACNGRRRNSENGVWEEKPNYFDVSVFGTQGEVAHRFLSRGRPVAVDGRLEWREWKASDGSKRQAVGIVAESVQFLGRPPAQATSNGDGGDEAAAPSSEPAEAGGSDLEGAPAPEPVAAGVTTAREDTGAEDGDDVPF